MTKPERNIVIAERGLVWLCGMTENSECNEYLMLADARIIRRWGTTRGLNQIACEGPTDQTVLDQETPVVKLHKNALIAVIPCSY